MLSIPISDWLRELEARWNAALQKVRELEDKLQEFDLGNGQLYRWLNKEVLLKPRRKNYPPSGTHRLPTCG